ncbi:MAG: four helix bundle protein [bacterium]|nr:four helix bundle protein [bacterium]
MSGQRGRSGQGGEGKSSGQAEKESILSVHGGYRNLKGFQVAQLVYDLTVRFCDSYIDRRSRTHDQMVQAARSGVQNIAEGSEAAATSKKMELKLTQVARASLEELKLDYEDFLRQRDLPSWDRSHPLRQDLVDARLESADEVAAWVVKAARRRCEEESGPSGQSGPSGEAPAEAPTAPSEPPPEEAADGFFGSRRPRRASTSDPSSEPHPEEAAAGFFGSRRPRRASTPRSFYPELSANAILTLATVAGFLLDRQIQGLAQTFEEEGGFTERLYRVRTAKRGKPRP